MVQEGPRGSMKVHKAISSRKEGSNKETRSNQEGPGVSRNLQEGSGGSRRVKLQLFQSFVSHTSHTFLGPCGSRRVQEGPGGSRRVQEGPGGSRGVQEGPGSRMIMKGPG